jgi:peptidoglycan/LPS O-acetylase OafA/YrhL
VAVRIPSLDGLRAASIVLVLLAHTAGSAGAPDLAWLRAIGDIGNLGVRVFFVISGLLMTLLLERQCDLTGRISVAAFLHRRAIRVVPAFGAYVAVIAIAGAAGIVVLRPRDLLMAATFTMNYHADRAWYVGHLWSLAVEVQFYIVWAVMRRLVGRGGMFWVALAGLALGPMTRVAVYVLAPEWRSAIGEAFPTVIDALATGALLAVLHDKLTRSHSYLTLLRSRALVLVPIALVALNAAAPHVAFSYPVGQTLMNLLIALAIHRVVLLPDSPTGRLLNQPAIVSFGAVSYSLYLWQQPFLNRASHSPFAAFPVNVALALSAALLSYRLVELPARRLALRVRNSSIGRHVEPAAGGLQSNGAAC